ncbi:regulatory protein GemA [Roseovarius mucosus]|uniref:gp16 family protein n=1 Tax=Roseovarius mucosus TaxID=215743 RepID=UPI001C5E3E39|nr:regulatory protein GemA [Roseovarius mucosus]MBW4975448.1 regulatory protein GemA [Roseovarius mucosus]
MNRALQQLIFAACRQLGLDEDARRDLQVSVTGKASLRDMNDGELKLVVNRLKQAGFADKPRNPRHKPAPRADLRMIHVLWRKLGQSGALRDPSRAGLNKFIRARFGTVWGSVPADVDMLRAWEQIDAVIQALKTWGHRQGIDFDWEDHRR